MIVPLCRICGKPFRRMSASARPGTCSAPECIEAGARADRVAWEREMYARLYEEPPPLAM